MTALLAILKRVPWLVWPLILALAFGAVEHLRAGSLGLELAAEKANAQAVLERTRATYTAEAASAASDALAKTQRRINDQQEAVHEAEKSATLARADADAERDAAGKLRQRFAALAARSCGSGATDHSVPTPSREAAQPAADLLADVLERVSEAAGSIAVAADQSRIAGNACEAAYGALVKP